MIIKILGWQMGFEPTTLGITIRCSNQLSYNHQKLNKYKKWHARQESNP